MLWLFIVLVVIAVAAIIAVFIINRRSGLGPSTGAPRHSGLSWNRRGSERVVELPRHLADSASLFQLPVVYKRIRTQRWLHTLLAALLVSGLMGAAAIAGRPVCVAERSDTLANRDIVLRPNVPTLMVRIDSSVLVTFSEILEDFDGERVGIVAWNSTTQTVVPLTDDHELLRDQLSGLGDVLDVDLGDVVYKQQLAYQEAFGGAVNSSINDSSLADGRLASCAQVSDNQGPERSRSIILTTDNQVIDPDNKQIYPLPDAAELLTERKIRLFSIYGIDENQPYQNLFDKTPEEFREELKTVTEEQGRGRFYDIEDSDTRGQIIKELGKTKVPAFGGHKQARRIGVPQRFVITPSLVLLSYPGLTIRRRV